MTAEEILAMVKKAQQTSGRALNIQTESLSEYGLGDYNCPVCNNTGHVITTKDVIQYARECECMKTRRTLRNIKNSGMEDMLKRYTFSSYETPDDERKKIKQKAIEYANAETGWLYIAGQSGSGKTHICTAICRKLTSTGHEVRYMLWRDEAVKLKANVNSEEYQQHIKKLKTVSVLYIDDFFKGKYTEADVNLAFELINSRYNNSNLRTIFSSELDIKQVLDIDEALGGRIYERAKDYMLASPAQNWRIK